MKIQVLVIALILLIVKVCAQTFTHESLEDYFQDDLHQDISGASAVEVRSGYSKGYCPEVCIDQGCLIGSTKVGNRQPYEAFYGIPYAAPPIGKLRFKNPEAPAKFNGLWDSTYHRDSCLQNSIRTGNIIGSEDCLYLNVYKPTGVKLGKRNRLPILVFLHGGSYKYGSSDPKHYGPEYLMDSQKFILVTPQFRQGVFGFLSSGDKNCQGNFGLKDQNMALKWVQANIKEFGGDPRRVTLMGEDSGASATHLHVISHRSDDLFQKAIFAGGHALACWAFDKSGVEKFQAYAKLAGISRSDRSDSEKIMKKLRKMSAYDLQALSHQMFSFHKVSKVFRPVIEGSWNGAFITSSPHTIWKSGEYQQRPYLMISSSYEEGHLADVIYNPDLTEYVLENFDQSLMIAGDLVPESLPPIKAYYFKNNPEKYFKMIGKFFKYWGYWHPGQITTYFYTGYGDLNKNPADHLLFNFLTNISLSSQIHQYAYPENGSSHSDFLLFMFRFSVLAEDFVRGPAEESAKNLLVSILTTYIQKPLKNWEDVYPRCTRKKAKVFCDYLTITRNGDNAVLGSDDYYDEGSIKVLNKVYNTLNL